MYDAEEDAKRSQTNDCDKEVECSAEHYGSVDHEAYIENIHVTNPF